MTVHIRVSPTRVEVVAKSMARGLIETGFDTPASDVVVTAMWPDGAVRVVPLTSVLDLLRPSQAAP